MFTFLVLVQRHQVNAVGPTLGFLKDHASFAVKPRNHAVVLHVKGAVSQEEAEAFGAFEEEVKVVVVIVVQNRQQARG